MYKGYTLGKHDFIHDVLRKAVFNRQRFVISAHAREWEAVKACRKQDAPLGEEEIPLSEFHKHIILYAAPTL